MEDSARGHAPPLSHVHRFIPASGNEQRTLLLLHGTGGDENDLVPLGRALLPGAAMLSPRGNVIENGMSRFFRRLAEGVFDQRDLEQRTVELARFIDEAAAVYGFDRDRVIAVGFSNGANIAASVMLRGTGALHRAVLLSPMVPFEPASPPALQGDSVFIGAGRADPIVPVEQVERLAELFADADAGVEVFWHRGGHTITNDELEAARRWLST
jgi:phospholipase/carboxylesterase/glyoxalase family protein